MAVDQTYVSFIGRYRRTIVLMGLLSLLAAAAFIVLDALLPVLIALTLSYLLQPAMSLMVRRGVPRSLAAVVLIVLALVVLWLVLFFVVPVLVREAVEVGRNLPVYLKGVYHNLQSLTMRYTGYKLPKNIIDAFHQVVASGLTPEAAIEGAAPAAAIFSTMLAGAFGILKVVFYAILVLVFSFFFLRDFPQITGRIGQLIPPDYRPFVIGLAEEIDQVIASFIRGQVIVCLVVGTLYAIGLAIIGVHYSVLIGFLAGFANFVPYLGLIIGSLLSAFFIAVYYQGPGQVIATAALFAVVPTLDGVLITPNIIGRKVGLTPVTVIVTMLVGAELFGFVGVLVAIPLAAVATILIRRGLDIYVHSRLYSGGTPPDGPAGLQEK